jgi:hypothetical protein
MDYRRTSLILNRQQLQQANLNPHIYPSFAGADAARNTNGIFVDTNTMWWDEERIEATVTRQFVCSKLLPAEQERLDEPLGFGDGLTDDTYWEWIELKAKRIFLILVDLGVPDQIFGVLDDSWDDDDLPVPLDQVERLRLTFDKDEKLEKKFFHRQFTYLLRYVQRGENVFYDDEEVVPLELAEKRPVGAVTGLIHSNVDKVYLPGKPDDVRSFGSNASRRVSIRTRTDESDRTCSFELTMGLIYPSGKRLSPPHSSQRHHLQVIPNHNTTIY